MKRIAAIFLSLFLSMALFACASTEVKEDAGKEKADLSDLTATELYARAADNMDLLASYELETTVSDGEETTVYITRRVREGYDRFAFSRVNPDSGEGTVFDGENAWILSPAGNFTAPATTVTFRSYWAETGFPVAGLEMEHFVRIERDGMKVSYDEADETAMAQFAALADFTVTGVRGEAEIDEELFISREEISVTGTAEDGAERTITLRTKALSHGDKNLAVAETPDEKDVMQVNDIRLPGLLQKAREELLEQENVSMTVVIEESAAGVTRSVGGTLNGVDGAYSLRESGVVATEQAKVQNRMIRALSENGSVHRAVYDGVTGKVLSDETVSVEGDGARFKDGATLPAALSAVLEGYLPPFSDFASAEMTESVSGYNVSFTLKEEASARLIREGLSRLGVDESAVDLSAFVSSGNLTVSKSDPAISSVFYEVRCGADTVALARISLSLTFGDAALTPVEAPTDEELGKTETPSH